MFRLNDEQLDAFDTSIDKICLSRSLAVLKAVHSYSIDYDARDYGVGCTLFHTHPDDEQKPIGFWFRSLLPEEKHQSASERESLAVLWALKTLRLYLMYKRFVLYTDRAALHWLLTIDNSSRQLFRWRFHLDEFDHEVKYKKYKINDQTDALSRMDKTGEKVPHKDKDDVQVFEQVMFCVESRPNHDPNEVYFIDTEFASMEKLCEAVDYPAPSNFNA